MSKNAKMELELENKIEKKTWQCPDLFSLDIKRTEDGYAISNQEDGTYHPDSQI